MHPQIICHIMVSVNGLMSVLPVAAAECGRPDGGRVAAAPHAPEAGTGPMRNSSPSRMETLAAWKALMRSQPPSAE